MVANKNLVSFLSVNGFDILPTCVHNCACDSTLGVVQSVATKSETARVTWTALEIFFYFESQEGVGRRARVEGGLYG